ncbi:V/A-type H+-transporting ATPase subunit D [Kribbella orskensis]|uniref:V-type ATP synthase subunit D n=1 Tax=Kribbella orskensis TaxID=2512216 RepID=A0ABY2BA09_9ACTN|nr:MULTISPECIES: V-type ATP synthase subunit D [Kribbella]TCN32909.1 V/A-type H+-transporting ATPase subunit D [Kribbella sp. VKM Ac-2500]TCO13217.1 V/A-type H+-transporting ATPase subunit D [Kribbella orskensis]
MQSLVATRSELLDRRRRAVFVAQGRDLLKDKRTALVREFRHHQTELLDGLERLRNLAVQARQRLDQATAVYGPEALASGALAAATGIGADLRSRTVAGVHVFDLRHDPVRRSPATRGWAPSLVSAHLDTVALAYEEQLEWLLDLCAVELSVRRLATEIERTTKQVNALDNIVLPQLHDEARRIALTLDEREREEHARLRRARTRRASRDATSDGPERTWSAA